MKVATLGAKATAIVSTEKIAMQVIRLTRRP